MGTVSSEIIITLLVKFLSVVDMGIGLKSINFSFHVHEQMKNLFKLHGIFFISYFFPTFPFPAVCSDNHVKFHFLHFRMLIGVNTSLSWKICKMLIFWVKFQSCRHFKGKNHANVYKASRTRFF